MIKTPTAITLHAQSRVLEVSYADGAVFRLPFELLRVYSPSAEVQGHGPGQETLQTGKREVSIVAVDPVGHYALKPTFSDGHDTGLFTWTYLAELGRDGERLFAAYLDELKAKGLRREG